MSSPLPFSEEHRDCLQEVCNIAMGAAGESLADFAKVFVNLSIPKIRYIQPKEIAEALTSLEGEPSVSSAVHIFSMGEHGGYALVVISDAGFEDLAKSVGRPAESDEDAAALLNELTLTINKTCLNHLAEMMETECEFYQPDILSLRVPLGEIKLDDIAGWNKVVSIEINYHLEHRPFNCDLLLLLPDVVVDELVAALESLLD